jgi:sugar/nucleoside kinase (ribokinase family)
VDVALLRKLSDRLLGWGAAIAMIKLGDQGAYLRTTPDAGRLQQMGACRPADIRPWIGAELCAPCYAAHTVGTTGSGDCTIAGLLGGLLKGLDPAGCLEAAVAVGAASVEAADATSGVPKWAAIQRRLSAGWKRQKSAISL